MLDGQKNISFMDRAYLTLRNLFSYSFRHIICRFLSLRNVFCFVR